MFHPPHGESLETVHACTCWRTVRLVYTIYQTIIYQILEKMEFEYHTNTCIIEITAALLVITYDIMPREPVNRLQWKMRQETANQTIVHIINIYNMSNCLCIPCMHNPSRYKKLGAQVLLSRAHTWLEWGTNYRWFTLVLAFNWNFCPLSCALPCTNSKRSEECWL